MPDLPPVRPDLDPVLLAIAPEARSQLEAIRAAEQRAKREAIRRIEDETLAQIRELARSLQS